jgi:hypothetical protein
MIQFELFSILIDWTNVNFQLTIGSFCFPVGNVFEFDNIFCLSNMHNEWYLEIFFTVIIGEKGT